jgi:hypothetical protein
LVQRILNEVAGLDGGIQLECAVRDLVSADLLCCRDGCVYPTPAGLEIQGEARDSLFGRVMRN